MRCIEVRDVDYHVTHPGDPGERRRQRGGFDLLASVEVDLQPGHRIAEQQRAGHPHGGAAGRIAPRRIQPELPGDGMRCFQPGFAFDLETDPGQPGLVACLEDEVERLVAATQPCGAGVAARESQADEPGVERKTACQVGAAQAAVAETREVKRVIHLQFPRHRMMLMRPCGRSASMSSTQVLPAIISCPSTSTMSCR